MYKMPQLKCSFCEKSQMQVKKLITGRGRVYICDECVHLCNEILEEEYDITFWPWRRVEPSTKHQ